MDIMELGAIGELAGGLAVFGSLLYVGLQLRQTTGALRANAAQALADALNQVNLTDASSLEHARAVRLAFEDPASLSEDERTLIDYLCLATCRSFESALLQLELGSLDADTAEMVHENVRVLFATDYFREWWARSPYPFTSRFKGFLARECGIAAGEGRP